jgi:hydroxymethylglutaryl-CoA synthase
MKQYGIEALHFYTCRYSLDLELLAKARGCPFEKYSVGLGQKTMSITPPDEDAVSLGASSAFFALQEVDKSQIAMLLFATETSTDQSKAGGLWIHELLGLPKNCRVVELKQACYGGCAGLQLGLDFLAKHPDKKVLVIASDIARYGLGAPGEPTQGCGACAFVLSSSPKIISFDAEYGTFAQHVHDFWRPNYKNEAVVDGKYSTKVYLEALAESWQDYSANSGRSFDDHEYFCYHIPFTRMALKAHERLVKTTGKKDPAYRMSKTPLLYSEQIGNSYTASLFIGLSSLLEHEQEDLTDKRIGFFSYGSGCMAEFFSGTVLPGYRQFLHKEQHQTLLSSRLKLGIAQYEEFYTFRLPEDGSFYVTPRFETGPFRLQAIEGHRRVYCKSS